MAKVTPSVMLDEMSGKAGSVVYVKTKRGVIVRPRRTPTNPNTPAQEAVRINFRKSSQAYKNMTMAQVAAWEAYAESLIVIDPVTDKHVHPSAITAFIKLAAKFLQVNPTGTIPLTPPTSDYNGDNITLTAVGATGKVTFTASAGNSPTTKTELLLQRLASKNRSPQAKKYLSKGFVAFESPGSLSADVTVTPGYYAAAYRFVNINTGQQTELHALPVATVSLALAAKKVA